MKKVFSFLVFFGITFIIAQKVPGSSSSPCIVGPDNLALNQTGIYSVSSALAQCTQCHDWDIDGLNVDVSSNAQITTDDRLNTVSIKRIGTGSITIKVTYFTEEEGCKECIKVLPACCGGNGSVTCDAWVVDKFWYGYTNYTLPTHDVMAHIEVNYTNPFPNNASVLVQYDPSYPSGFCHGNCSPVNATPNFTGSIQYQISLPIGSYGMSIGFCVPLIVTYTDLVTGQKCIKILNPCFTKEDGGIPRKNNTVNISPNPAKSILNIEGENLENLNISFYDTFGNEVIKNSKVEKTLNIDNLKPGIYLYKIKDKDNIIQDGKIIKE